jgi:hypothetical protein
MLTLVGGQVESLWDEVLPTEARELPEDLAGLNRLLPDATLLRPIERAWAQTARGHGRPSISMATFLRLMVIKQRTDWGYETLVREVSDSLHLRRFWRKSSRRLRGASRGVGRNITAPSRTVVQMANRGFGTPQSHA